MISNVQMDGVHKWDYPDLCDAFICYAEKDGIPLTDAELDELNNDRDFVHEKALESLQ